MSWRKLIPRCFSKIGREFAMHETEAKSARKLLVTAIKEKATLEEILQEAENWLSKEGTLKKDINTQLSRMRKLENWLD